MRKVSVIRAAAACGFSLAMVAAALPMVASADDAGLAPETIQEQAGEVSSKPISIDNKSYATFAEALAAGDATGARTLVLNSDVKDDTFAVWPDSDITLNLSGHNVSLSAPIAVAGKLTIVDNAAGDSTPSYSDAGITYASVGVISYNGKDHTIKVSDTAEGHQGSTGGSLTLISGHIGGDSIGGGVLVEGGASFSMEGGVVESKDNSAVKVTQGSTFTLTGGIVYAHDYTAIMGDGYMNMGNTTINIEGGSVLSSMDVAGHVAAGVCHVQDGGALNVSGGEVRTLSNGVGVIVDQGTFNLSGGEVYGKGSDLNGTTASGISIKQGWALLLNHVSAASSISGGFISSDAGVATVKIVDSMPRARSIVGGKGVSITGGTFTNFEGLSADAEYRGLGHSMQSREGWTTVMKEIETPEVDTNNVSAMGVPTRAAHIYAGDMTYYRKGSEVSASYSATYENGGTVQFDKVYSDYPTLEGYAFAGWWADPTCKNAVKQSTETSDEAIYARLVDGYMLAPIFQAWTNVLDEVQPDESTHVIITGMAEENPGIALAGTEISYTSSDESIMKYDLYTSKVGRKLYSAADPNGFTSEYRANYFVPTAGYFFGGEICVSSEDFDKKINYNAYWIMQDGTKVCGTQDGSKSVNEYIAEHSEQANVSHTVDTGNHVATVEE